jgi:hypothetical protein
MGDDFVIYLSRNCGSSLEFDRKLACALLLRVVTEERVAKYVKMRPSTGVTDAGG